MERLRCAEGRSSHERACAQDEAARQRGGVCPSQNAAYVKCLSTADARRSRTTPPPSTCPLKRRLRSGRTRTRRTGSAISSLRSTLACAWSLAMTTTSKRGSSAAWICICAHAPGRPGYVHSVPVADSYHQIHWVLDVRTLLCSGSFGCLMGGDHWPTFCHMLFSPPYNVYQFRCATSLLC